MSASSQDSGPKFAAVQPRMAMLDYWWCGVGKCTTWHTSKERAMRCPRRRRAINAACQQSGPPGETK